ncbi:MAG: hypothetical protein LBM38_01150 [Clostridiales bacterium]|jgi:hypothetical protein|nr:hypothetical protein [Clostridiales bacterium]
MTTQLSMNLPKLHRFKKILLIFILSLTLITTVASVCDVAPILSQSTGNTVYAEPVIPTGENPDDLLGPAFDEIAVAVNRGLGLDFSDGFGDAVAAMALSLVALFFVIEVVNKSVALEKVTMETVIKLLLQLLVAKILVENAPEFMAKLESGLTGLGNKIGTITLAGGDDGWKGLFKGYTHLAGTNAETALITDGGGVFIIVNLLALANTMVFFNFIMPIIQLIGGDPFTGKAMGLLLLVLIPVYYIQSGVAIGAGLGLEAAFSGAPPELGVLEAILSGWTNLFVMWANLLMIALNGVAYLLSIVVVKVLQFFIYIDLLLRALELQLLLALSPLAMAAFVSDEFRSNTKKFIMSFATVCLQGVIIVIMCRVCKALFTFDEGTGLLGKMMIAGNIMMPNPFNTLLTPIIGMLSLKMLIGKSRGFASAILGG